MPKHGFDYEVPVFCYIVVEADRSEPTSVEWDGGNYIATCINLQIDGYGSTLPEAERNMAINVFEYVQTLFQYGNEPDAAWGNILKLWLHNPRSSALWDVFNAAQIELAKEGHSLDSHSALNEKCEKIYELEKRVRELEEQLGINAIGAASIASAIADDMIVQEGKLVA
jgi:hypothetical protein